MSYFIFRFSQYQLKICLAANTFYIIQCVRSILHNLKNLSMSKKLFDIKSTVNRITVHGLKNVIKIQSTYKCKQPQVFEQPHLGARIRGKTAWWRRWRR